MALVSLASSPIDRRHTSPHEVLHSDVNHATCLIHGRGTVGLRAGQRILDADGSARCQKCAVGWGWQRRELARRSQPTLCASKAMRRTDSRTFGGICVSEAGKLLCMKETKKRRIEVGAVRDWRAAIVPVIHDSIRQFLSFSCTAVLPNAPGLPGFERSHSVLDGHLPVLHIHRREEITLNSNDSAAGLKRTGFSE